MILPSGAGLLRLSEAIGFMARDGTFATVRYRERDRVKPTINTNCSADGGSSYFSRFSQRTSPWVKWPARSYAATKTVTIKQQFELQGNINLPMPN